MGRPATDRFPYVRRGSISHQSSLAHDLCFPKQTETTCFACLPHRSVVPSIIQFLPLPKCVICKHSRTGDSPVRQLHGEHRGSRDVGNVSELSAPPARLLASLRLRTTRLALIAQTPPPIDQHDVAQNGSSSRSAPAAGSLNVARQVRRARSPSPPGLRFVRPRFEAAPDLG